jgi:predicted DNA-binding transcriptional regulator AlpA
MILRMKARPKVQPRVRVRKRAKTKQAPVKIAPSDTLTMDMTQLAAVLRLSPSRVKQLSSLNPERLPPRVRHGGRKVLFLRSVVESWLSDRSMV